MTIGPHKPETLVSGELASAMAPVRSGVEDLAAIGATTYHDLCGRMFQTLISDREFLATFYTLPPSACLLAELSVERLSVDWSDAEAVGNLQVGDFACGTGALLSAVQRAIHRRYRRAGGDDGELHRRMMEHSLVGLDIMPAAAHLTCSMLSSAHPGVAYGSARIHTMPYGAHDGAVHIGSLDLLREGRSWQRGSGLELYRPGPRQTDRRWRAGAGANRGIYHMDINGTGGRGAFDIRRVEPGEVPSYVTLWSHDARRETRLIVGIDSVAEPRAGYQAKARKTWDRTASRLHSNRDFQLNSQPLAMCLTAGPSIGGRAWPNVIPHDASHEVPLLLWANTTLGLIGVWWAGTRQQQGRAVMTLTKLPDLPVFDTRTLSDDQIELCEVVFEELKDRDFLPANEADRDKTRLDLDRHILVDVLGLDKDLLGALDTLRLQWCAEPSVHGGKGTRPDGR
ncbi:MAG: hypothetical protein F4053_15750 [Proteobacteria bacterium]|nr:hypothetical protein [Pseudomonadota bacterium]MYJ96969.1 hypothetical protein [Pseudomonadota bacterium]